MNSLELWNYLYDMSTTEIQVQFTMIFIYLIKHRGLKKEEIIKDLEKLYKKVVV